MRHLVRPVALGLGIGWAIAVFVTFTATTGKPVDALCYYAIDPAAPWDRTNCFLYSPPIAQLMIGVQSVISFEVFYTVLRGLELLVLLAVTGPAIGLVLFIPAVAIEINAANINLLIVAAVLAGFRYSWTWSFVVLTKFSLGVGLLWFAVRGEWRQLGIALGATMALVVGSFAVAPWMWWDYRFALFGAVDDSPFKLWWRLPLAALIVTWGARNDHRWTVIVAVFLALPRWYVLSPVILVGLFPLVTFPRPLPWSGLVPATLRRLSARPAASATSAQPAAATSDGLTVRAPSS